MEIIVAVIGIVVLAGIAIYSANRISNDVVMSKEQFDKLLDTIKKD